MSDRFEYRSSGYYKPSEIDPGPCKTCGATLSVCWGIAVEPAGEIWTRRCLACQEPWEQTRVWLAVAVDGVGSLTVWQRDALMHEPGTIISQTVAGVLASRIAFLAGLQSARSLEKVKPGKWRLQLREDGTLWAPWAPDSRRKGGAPWPFRLATLAAKRLRSTVCRDDTKPIDRRACRCCRSPLTAGDQVWRPDAKHWTADGVTHRERAGWTKTLLASVLVCESCAGKAQRGFLPVRLRLVQALVAALEAAP